MLKSMLACYLYFHIAMHYMVQLQVFPSISPRPYIYKQAYVAVYMHSFVFMTEPL